MLADMMNNGKSVNFLNGFINDLSGAAMEVQKEAKVCSSYPYFIVLSLCIAPVVFLFSCTCVPC